MIYDPFDVVIVPFPFTDSSTTKKRPAVILSTTHFQEKIGHAVMAMVTSAKNSPWPHDVKIKNLEACGLEAPSVVRLKLFTLDLRFVLRKSGTLSETDQLLLRQALQAGLVW